MSFATGLAVLLAASSAAPAGEAGETMAPVEITRSRTVPAAAGGVVEIDETWGEVDVEAWDRPEVEVTMTARSKGSFSGAKAAEAKARLERFTFDTSTATPNQVSVTGISPKASLFKPFGGKSGLSVRYAIKMPRASSLVLNHDVGEVKVSGITGNLEVANGTGSVRLAVPLDPAVAVRTSANIGDADLGSELRARGEYKQRALVGHRFVYQPAGAQRHVEAKVGIGSVSID